MNSNRFAEKFTQWKEDQERLLGSDFFLEPAAYISMRQDSSLSALSRPLVFLGENLAESAVMLLKMATALGYHAEQVEWREPDALFASPHCLVFAFGPKAHAQRERFESGALSGVVFLELPHPAEFLNSPELKKQVWEKIKPYRLA